MDFIIKTMIIYLNGDATKPKYPGMKIICHVNNNIGKWGKGFVLAVSNRWPETRKKFLKLGKWDLGDVQLLPVEDDIIVANMVAQNGIGKPNVKRIDYDALKLCLKIVADYARTFNCSIHMPRIGCGLGGGNWKDIEDIIDDTMSGLDIFVYDFE